MTGVWHDVQHGFRMLGRSPLVTAAVVFALAASIGANTVLFTVIDEAMLRPLPYPQARRLITVWESWLDRGFSRLPVLPADFLEWQTQAGLFDELAAFKSTAFSVVPMLELLKSTPGTILRTGTQVGVRSHTRVWHVFVVCETAMALMLTTGATLAARSLERL